jgi:hypothetical protein
MRNTSGVKVALDSKAARFNVKKRELDENVSKSKHFEVTVSFTISLQTNNFFIVESVQEGQQRYRI